MEEADKHLIHLTEAMGFIDGPVVLDENDSNYSTLLKQSTTVCMKCLRICL
jgi:hypothetical protein